MEHASSGLNTPRTTRKPSRSNMKRSSSGMPSAVVDANTRGLRSGERTAEARKAAAERARRETIAMGATASGKLRPAPVAARVKRAAPMQSNRAATTGQLAMCMNKLVGFSGDKGLATATRNRMVRGVAEPQRSRWRAHLARGSCAPVLMGARHDGLHDTAGSTEEAGGL